MSKNARGRSGGEESGPDRPAAMPGTRRARGRCPARRPGPDARPVLRRNPGRAEDRGRGAGHRFGGGRTGGFGRDGETKEGPRSERRGRPSRGLRLPLARLRTPDPAALLGLPGTLGRAAEAAPRPRGARLPPGAGDRQAALAGVHPDRAGSASLDGRTRHPLTAAPHPAAGPPLPEPRPSRRGTARSRKRPHAVLPSSAPPTSLPPDDPRLRKGDGRRAGVVSRRPPRGQRSLPTALPGNGRPGDAGDRASRPRTGRQDRLGSIRARRPGSENAPFPGHAGIETSPAPIRPDRPPSAREPGSAT